MKPISACVVLADNSNTISTPPKVMGLEDTNIA